MTRYATLRQLIKDTPALLALGERYEAIAGAINLHPQVTNPAERGLVDAPISLDFLMTLATDQEQIGFLADADSMMFFDNARRCDLGPSQRGRGGNMAGFQR